MQGSYEKAGNTVLDPVCGMYVVPDKAAAHVRHEEKDYYFCSKHCAQKFSTNPAGYLQRKPVSGTLVQLGAIPPEKRSPMGQGIGASRATHSAPSAATKAARYICPMDPEVMSDVPGACPKCGMSLEPRITAPG